MVLKADINACKLIDFQANTGEVNARTLEVEMTDELLACAMSFVTFKLKDGTLYESLVKDGKAELPYIERSQFVEVGLYSADIEDGECVKRYSPHPSHVCWSIGSYAEGAETPPMPTPGAYAELLEMIKSAGSGETIKTVNSPKIWELDAGVYRVSSVVSYGEFESSVKINGINLMNKVGFLMVGLNPSLNDQRDFYLFANGRIYFGYSVDMALKIEGAILGEFSKVTKELSTASTPDEIPTAEAVVGYVNETIGGIENGSY